VIFSLVKARGHSMEPKIKDGSFFIASSLPYFFKKPKLDEIIIFKNSGKIIVKQIEKIFENKYFISGINKSDSKVFNPITGQEILGKVIWIF